MADTKRELILKQVVSQLQASGKPAGLTVHRFRTRPIQKDNLPAMVVYALSDSTELSASGQVDHELRVGIQCRTKATVGGESPDEQLDPLYSWAVKQMKADQTLGGHAQMVDELGTEWDAVELDQIYGACEITFGITHITLEDDPETAA